MWRLLIFTVLCVAWWSSVSAQRLLFEHYDRTDGLPSDYLFDVFQDRTGFVWVGTDKGAARYDGRTFKVFNTDNGLPDNMVYCIREDAAGRIWFSTFEGGICYYDGQRFHYPAPLRKIVARYMATDSHGRLLISANRERLLVWQQERLDTVWMPDAFKYGISIVQTAPDRFVWRTVGGHRPVPVMLHSTADSLLVYPLTGSNHGAVPMRRDVIDVDPLVRSYLYGYRTIMGLSGHQLTERFACESTEVQCAAYSRNWGFFVGGRMKGLWHKPDQLGAEQSYNHDTGFPANYIEAISEDREGNVWVASFGKGLFRTVNDHLHVVPEVRAEVKNIFVSQDGTVYIGGPDGLSVWSGPDKPIRTISATGDYRFDVRTVTENSAGQLFIGTLARVFGPLRQDMLQRGQDANWQGWPFIIMSEGISGSAIEGDSVLWVSTYGGGVKRLPLNRLGQISDSDERYDIPGIASGMTRHLYQTPSAIWALTYGDGLARIARTQVRMIDRKDGLLSNNVYTVFEEQHGAVWIGTDQGVSLMRDNMIQNFSAAQGIRGKKALLLFRDRQERLWLLTDEFLHLWQKDRFQAIGSFPILPPGHAHFINRAVFDPARQWIWLGTSEGLVYLDLAHLRVHEIKPVLLLQQGRLGKWPIQGERPVRMLLPHDASQVHLDFAILSFANETENRLYAWLEGRDTTWVPEPHQVVHYDYLPTGQYRLRVRAENADGVFSDEWVMDLVVMPPWWLRWWVILIEVLLGVLLTTAIVRYYSFRKLRAKLQEVELARQLQQERERISRDLHDNVGSTLSYITTNLDHIALRHREIATQADQLSDFTRQATQQLRDTVWSLSHEAISTDELISRIQDYAARYSAIGHCIQVIHTGSVLLKPLQALNLYRIAQEAVNNKHKYAPNACQYISITSNPTTLKMLIEDNGAGFELASVPTGHYGLRNMEQRATDLGGSFKLLSRPEMGTRIEVQIPL